MPYFRLETNLPKSKIPENFASQLTEIISSTLGKPKQYCVAAVIPDIPMSWGGDNSPCGIGRLLSIGKLGVEENKKYSAVLFDHIEKILGIPRNKLYIQFVDETAANMGYNGTTFHTLFGN